MPDLIKKPTTSSTIVYENLEEFARMKMQELVQSLLEQEIEELLGRIKHQRLADIDAKQGYRNGYGKPRKLHMASGEITLKRPRVRDLEERFESKVLPLFVRRTKVLNELLPELYLHGLSTGDFDLALRGLLGDDAPVSASTICRLKEKWQSEWESWKNRDLSKLNVTYLWVDGVYIKAGLEKEKACLFVAIAGLANGKKTLIGLAPGYRESNSSWSDFLRQLKNQGMNAPKLIVGDGNLGIWNAVNSVFPGAKEQRCWNHRICNVIDKVPRKKQSSARNLLKKIPASETKLEAENAKKNFQRWAERNELTNAADLIDEDWDRMITFYSFPKEHWRHLRTSNIIESPFAALKLRTNAAKRFRKVENATAMIWKILLVAEQRFNRLCAPHLLREVFDGARFEDGFRVRKKSSDRKIKRAA